MAEPFQSRPILTDRFHRTHNYLRISLTDNCDLRCTYCMPEEDHAVTPSARLLQPVEIEGIARIFTSLGVNKIRLTGGEPLIRKDAADIIGRLAQLPVVLTLTTNGTRLHQYTELLSACGIRSLNISLDTLDPDRFLLMTRRNLFAQVKSNIDEMVALGFQVKVNTVVMKGVNDDELEAFIRWTRNLPIHVRFIEFMPFTGNRWQPEAYGLAADPRAGDKCLRHLPPGARYPRHSQKIRSERTPWDLRRHQHHDGTFLRRLQPAEADGRWQDEKLPLFTVRDGPAYSIPERRRHHPTHPG